MSIFRQNILEKQRRMGQIIEAERTAADRQKPSPPPTPLARPGGGTEMLFGKPTGAFSTGATITLDPCDIHGTDNGHANITAYVQPSQASYSMTNSTTIPVTAICPYVLGSDGSYYLLGTPIEIVTDVDVDGSNNLLTKKTRNVWVLTVGTESSAVTVHTGTECAS
jgi:hypothetical protein